MNNNLSNLWNGITGAVGGAWNGLKNFATSIGNNVTSSSPNSYQGVNPQSMTTTPALGASAPITASAALNPAPAPAPVQSTFGIPVANAQTTSVPPPTTQYSTNPGINNNLAPVNYGISTTGNTPINSSSTNASNTIDTALAARRNAENSMLNGSSSSVPSTEFLKNLMNNYSTASSNYTNSAAAMNQQRLAELNAVESAYTQGGMTTSGRNAAINDINQRYGNTFSVLETGNQAANANMDAYSRFYSTFMKPQEISPGSSLMTPQGQIVGQAGGASPQTIMSGAMSLWQAAGSPLNADGTPAIQPYLSSVQQYYNGGMSGSIGTGTTGTSGYPGVGTGVGTGANNTGTGQLPAVLQTYLGASGGSYINETKVPANQQNLVKQLAAQNGIPYLSAENLTKYQNIEVTQSNLAQLQSIIPQILSSGITGRLKGLTVNKISEIAQTNPIISSFDNYRDTALNTIQALAGGSGSGFRLNQAEIDVATSNLPEITDNAETANAKLGVLNSFLSKWQSEMLTGKPTDTSGFSSSAAGGNQTSSGSNVIQTKVGAVDNSWF